MKKYKIIYCNDWGVWCDLFIGTKQECMAEYENHIGKYESLDAVISPAGKKSDD